MVYLVGLAVDLEDGQLALVVPVDFVAGRVLEVALEAVPLQGLALLDVLEAELADEQTVLDSNGGKGQLFTQPVDVWRNDGSRVLRKAKMPMRPVTYLVAVLLREGAVVPRLHLMPPELDAVDVLDLGDLLMLLHHGPHIRHVPALMPPRLIELALLARAPVVPVARRLRRHRLRPGLQIHAVDLDPLIQPPVVVHIVHIVLQVGRLRLGRGRRLLPLSRLLRAHGRLALLRLLVA